MLPATPCRSRRKSELIANIAADCDDTLTKRQRIFAEVLDTWSMHELHVLIAARLRDLGYMAPVGQRPRKPDLIAAIVRAVECAATAPTEQAAPQCHMC